MTSNLKITEAEYINMLNMVNSSDKSNLNVVQSILENMDIDTNIVYILMLYKEINNDQRCRGDVTVPRYFFTGGALLTRLLVVS